MAKIKKNLVKKKKSKKCKHCKNEIKKHFETLSFETKANFDKKILFEENFILKNQISEFNVF